MVIMPTQDNVIIKLPTQEKEKKTDSGIIISTSAAKQQEMPEEGTVVAVGSGRLLSSGERVAPQVMEGDKIIFNKFAGTKITSGNEEYLIIKENDILAVIK